MIEKSIRVSCFCDDSSAATILSVDANFDSCLPFSIAS